MLCQRCGHKLEIEYVDMESNYPLVCYNCDENMFIFEGIDEYKGESEDMYDYISVIKLKGGKFL